MEATTINIHVNVPRSYRIDLLERQLTSYAEQLIAQAKPSRKSKLEHRHEALCGIFSSGASEEELVEDYLKDKYRAIDGYRGGHQPQTHGERKQ